ncbi:hypothetical protein FA13DRAFT_1782917 [Coprinellus micaceus]|uniref:Uncharacterized protein n=1 Tax=Coprinellus micaceus TaxID=71717 RepID=A0A4Y7RTE8_COPMI|nr:hypothetical protein FA13DRAFT_1782917 [Coprinellus micaceus]
MSLPAPLSALLAPLTYNAVFDALQTEFCPLLDSTLVAALLLEVDFHSSSQNEIASALQTVYDALKSIAVDAEAEAIAEELQDLGSPPRNLILGPLNLDLPLHRTIPTGTSIPMPSPSLRTALPHLPTRILINALVEWDEKEAQGLAVSAMWWEMVGMGHMDANFAPCERRRGEGEWTSGVSESDLGSDEFVPGEDSIDGLYLGGIGFHADEERDHLAQLEADEKLARELAIGNSRPRTLETRF